MVDGGRATFTSIHSGDSLDGQGVCRLVGSHGQQTVSANRRRPAWLPSMLQVTVWAGLFRSGDRYMKLLGGSLLYAGAAGVTVTPVTVGAGAAIGIENPLVSFPLLFPP